MGSKQYKEDPEKYRQLMNKLQVQNDSRTTFLSKSFFAQLSDEEFTVLWYMPGIEIICSDRTMKYINTRRQALGLKRTKHNIVKKL